MIFNDEDTIHYIIRRHWLVFAIKMLVLALGALVPLAGALALPQEALEEIVQVVPQTDLSFAFLYVLWLILLWHGAFVYWTNYHLDVWLVTDSRFIDIEQKRLFRREATSVRLEKIQDVTVSVRGFLETIFGFGTITVRTAGDNPDIVIKTAANPYVAKEQILDMSSRAIKRLGASMLSTSQL